jgi:predicted dithiol-disulfide oxidoreductase (DUF899 family)
MGGLVAEHHQFVASDARFPGESASYREARNELLEAEIELRQRIQEVAALRRKLPLGGVVPLDYEFTEAAADVNDLQAVRKVKLSELFTRQKASLVVYSFMYGPRMDHACPNCTSILDSLDRTAPHATQRINLAVVAKSPIERVRSFADTRGWRNLRLLSSAGSSFNHDYHGETESGSQNSTLNVFAQRDGKVYHVYGAEMQLVPTKQGSDPCHVDMIWPLWNLFDYTPEGRGSEWYPKLKYPS